MSSKEEVENKRPTAAKISARLESNYEAKDSVRIHRLGLEHRSVSENAMRYLAELGHDKAEDRIASIALKHEGDTIIQAIQVLAGIQSEASTEQVENLLSGYPECVNEASKALIQIDREEAMDVLGRSACNNEDAVLSVIFNLSASKQKEAYLWIGRIGEKYAHTPICVTAFEKMLNSYESSISDPELSWYLEDMREAIQSLRFSILEEESLRELIESLETQEEKENLVDDLRALFERSGRIAPVHKDPIINIRADLISAADIGSLELP